MADFPLIGGAALSESVGFDDANTRGTAVTSSGTANTVGSWVELQSAANNTFSSNSVTVVVSTLATGYTSLLVNLAIGAAASETTVISNLFCTIGNSPGFSIYTFRLPLYIPSSVRIAANCQASGVSQTCYVDLIREKDSFFQSSSLNKVTAYGADTTNTGGVEVARSSANTFGSWVEITSSTTNPIKGFLVSAQRGADSWSNGKMTYEVAVGSSGNENIIYQGHMSATSSSEAGSGLVSPFIPVSVASGQRLAVRAKSDDADVDFDFDYIIYGAN